MPFRLISTAFTSRWGECTHEGIYESHDCCRGGLLQTVKTDEGHELTSCSGKEVVEGGGERGALYVALMPGY